MSSSPPLRKRKRKYPPRYVVLAILALFTLVAGWIVNFHFDWLSDQTVIMCFILALFIALFLAWGYWEYLDVVVISRDRKPGPWMSPKGTGGNANNSRGGAPQRRAGKQTQYSIAATITSIALLVCLQGAPGPVGYVLAATAVAAGAIAIAVISRNGR